MKELALHILDIVQNSIRAGACEIKVSVDESPDDDMITVVIADNGCGMDKETLDKAADPYFTSRTTRKVGLGLSLLKMNASLAGGDMKISSDEGKGTTVTATFRYNNIDRPPLGDIAGTIALMISANPAINLVYNHTFKNNSWSISTKDIKEELGESSVTDLQIVRGLRELINENISELKNIETKHD